MIDIDTELAGLKQATLEMRAAETTAEKIVLLEQGMLRCARLYRLTPPGTPQNEVALVLLRMALLDNVLLWADLKDELAKERLQ